MPDAADPIEIQPPPHVEAALVGQYNRRVHVLEGHYHLWAGNLRETVKARGRRREQIVGALMRCGAVERDGAWVYEWAHRAIAVEAAAAIAVPCPDCFPTREAAA